MKVMGPAPARRAAMGRRLGVPVPCDWEASGTWRRIRWAGGGASCLGGTFGLLFGSGNSPDSLRRGLHAHGRSPVSPTSAAGPRCRAKHSRSDGDRPVPLWEKASPVPEILSYRVAGVCSESEGNRARTRGGDAEQKNDEASIHESGMTCDSQLRFEPRVDKAKLAPG